LWEFDLSGLIIRFFERLGWSWNVQRVPYEVQQTYAQRVAAAHQYIQELKANLLTTLAQASETVEEWRQRTSLRSYYEKTKHRLSEIRRTVRHSPHIKRTTLVAYQKEISQLLRAPFKRSAS
jgi:hypothetical protein